MYCPGKNTKNPCILPAFWSDAIALSLASYLRSGSLNRESNFSRKGSFNLLYSCAKSVFRLISPEVYDSFRKNTDLCILC